MNRIRKYRQAILVIMDILVIFSAYLISGFLLSNNAKFLSSENLNRIINTIFVSLFVYEIMFNLFSLYKNITRYENGKDYCVYIVASAISTGVMLLLSFVLRLDLVEFKQIILAGMLIAVATITYRIVIRFILTGEYVSPNEEVAEEKKNLLIIGAGEASRELIKTIRTSLKGRYNIVGLIDDNTNKTGYLISGVRILGNRYKIQEICKRENVSVIFFSIANISNIDKKEILGICQETGAKIRVLPGAIDIIKGKTLLQNLRDVEIEDILGRDPITLDNEGIAELIKDKCVMVTGGGGSIGSELCRQIVKYEPKTLVIFDIYENNLYNIEMELRYNHYDDKIKIVPIVGSVRDSKKLDKVFSDYKPSLVFHAAAHKHVPLMEINPLEAIKNNTIGTYKVAKCADKYGTKRFILISTDKAVNPTNIMGASKRMCEMVIQAMSKVSKTKFAAVRFGNVLGSNGSVVPLFKKQIAAGGPVTITHKEITRFFMTIPEAVGLVLQAMTYAEGGEIFVLDMGQPVKIYDLACSLIKLSGLEPNVDIQIKEVGLRPGEKLYEELLMAEEGLKQTAHNKIFIGKLQEIDFESMEKNILVLKDMVSDENININKVKKQIRAFVPTYKEPEEVNAKKLAKKNQEKQVKAG